MEWISVKERLPESGVPVKGLDKYGHERKVARDWHGQIPFTVFNHGGWIALDAHHPAANITLPNEWIQAWLPAPPEDE